MSNSEFSHPRVGVAVLIERNQKILLGKRKGSHGAGTYAFPGGHLEFGETLEECAKREILEETGLEISNIKILGITEDFFTEDNKHYITICVGAKCDSGDPKILEVDKCDSWEWYDKFDLPYPLFKSTLNFLNTHDINPYGSLL